MTNSNQTIPHDLVDYLRAEQVKLMYGQLPIQLISQLLLMLLVIYIFWELVSHRILVSLGLVMFLYVTVRLIFYRNYQLHGGGIEDAKRWGRYVLIGATVAGSIWGGAGLLLFLPDQLEYQLLMIFIVASLGAAAFASVSVDTKVFYAFFITSYVPITVMMFLQADHFHVVIGLACVLYVFVLISYSHNVHRSFIESVRLRYELNQQKTDAERANIAKSKFLAAASHDLRQPLHALTLFGSALQERIHFPEVRQIVDKMNLSIAALESLFASLLDISKLDAGTLQPKIGHHQLNALLERLQDDYSHQAREEGLEFSCEVCDAVVLTDATMLERILRNLIINAIRYTDAGQITLRCIPLEEVLRIEVCDSGPGIAARHLDEIFEEFTQLNNPERDRSKGMGLGLAIVKRTAALLNHKISVVSEVGKGSIFTVEVPYGETNLRAADAPSSQSSPADLNKLYAVLIDDERAVCEGMQVLLAGWGCELESFASVEEARQHLSAQRSPDAILVDYRLRDDKTGVEAIHSLNQFFQRDDIPALILTGDTAPDRLREAQASGYQLLHKPVAPAKLRAFLQHVQRTATKQRD